MRPEPAWVKVKKASNAAAATTRFTGATPGRSMAHLMGSEQEQFEIMR